MKLGFKLVPLEASSPSQITYFSLYFLFSAKEETPKMSRSDLAPPQHIEMIEPTARLLFLYGRVSRIPLFCRVAPLSEERKPQSTARPGGCTSYHLIMASQRPGHHWHDGLDRDSFHFLRKWLRSTVKKYSSSLMLCVQVLVNPVLGTPVSTRIWMGRLQ